MGIAVFQNVNLINFTNTSKSLRLQINMAPVSYHGALNYVVRVCEIELEPIILVRFDLIRLKNF